MVVSFRLKPANQYEVLVGLFFLSLAFLEWIPNNLDFGLVSFSCCFSCLLFFWLLDFQKNKYIYKSELKLITFIFLILSINMLAAVLNSVDLLDWIRSSVFILVWVSLLFFIRFYNFLRLDYLFSVFIFSGCIWMVMQILKADSLVGVILSGARLTYTNQNFILPYPLFICLILVLFYKDSLLKFLILIFSFVVLVGTGYKAHILIFFLGMAYYALINVRKFLYFLSLIFLPALYFYDFFYNYISFRFKGVGGESDLIRIREWEAAIDLFNKSPLLGAGLGSEFYIGSGWGDIESYRTYVHNSAMYFLATLGIFGSLLIAFFIGIVLVNKKKKYNLKLLFVLLIFSTLTAASYKLIHFNIMLVLVVYAILYADKGEKWV